MWFPLALHPGAGDIINNRSSGLNNFYVPETGLPADTQIYVTIGYYKAGQDFTTCSVETFRTEAVTSPPGCTTLVEPFDQAVNIAAETKLEWNYAPGATGYLLSIGTTPHGKEVVDNLDVGNVLTFDPPEGLPADGAIYVALTPYNTIGKATSCAEEHFTTTSVVIDCGPFFDYKTGQSVSFRPELDFPDQIGLCKNRSATIVESKDVAAGYRWFAVHPDGTETLLSSTRSIELLEVGNYRYEAYNLVTRSTSTVECSNSRTFSVHLSETAVISSIEDDEIPSGRRLKINVTGNGNYEYAIDNREGPFQNSAVFENDFP